MPGVIMFEIDGLAEPVLRHALDSGHAPTMARWIEGGSHRIVPWECDLSSQTGASQAGLLLGSNEDMPAFRWYEKESGQTIVSNHSKDAVELEQRHSDGGGLLAAGGASRGNLFSGDAPHCSATMSVLSGASDAPVRASTSPTLPIPTASRERSLSISGTSSRSCAPPDDSAGGGRSTSTAAGCIRS